MGSKQFASLVGQEIGDRDRYLLESMLGSDEIGVVFQATKLAQPGISESASQGSCLVKVFPVDLATQIAAETIWQRQVNHLKLIQDPKLVSVLDGGTLFLKANSDKVKEYPFVVMERLNLPTLAQVLAPTQAIDPKRAVLLAGQIAAALQVLYQGSKIRSRSGQIIKQMRFWHGNLNPTKVLLVNGAQATIKLADFGIFNILDQLEQMGLVSSFDPLDPSNLSNSNNPEAGSTGIAFFAPEQLRSPFKTDIHTDIYALGCMLYQMLSGEHPYRLAPYASQTAWLDAIAHQSPVELAPELAIPASLQAVLRRCLQKEPTQRYATIAELQTDLRRIASDPERTAIIATRPPGSINSRIYQHSHHNRSTGRSAPLSRQKFSLLVLGMLAGAAVGIAIIARFVYQPQRLATAGTPDGTDAIGNLSRVNDDNNDQHRLMKS
jgi:serine/threonine protein kinase